MALQDSKRAGAEICQAARPLIDCIKEELALSSSGQETDCPAFLQALSERIGPLEEALTRAGN